MGFSPWMVMILGRAVLIVDWIKCRDPDQTLGPFFPGSVPADSRSKGRVIVYSPWWHREVGSWKVSSLTVFIFIPAIAHQESFQNHLRYISLLCWQVGSAKTRTFECFSGPKGGWLSSDRGKSGSQFLYLVSPGQPSCLAREGELQVHSHRPRPSCSQR